MEQLVLDAINSCNWSSTKFLVISENVFAPLIYYSHLGSLVVALLFGCFVFLSNRKNLLNRILFYLTLSLSIWLFGDLVLWANDKPAIVMFFWSLINIFEPIIYALALHFIYVFIDGKEIPIKEKLVICILLSPIFLFSFTNYGLLGFDLTNCDRAVFEGFLPKYGYFIEILFSFWIFIFAWNRIVKNKYPEIRKKILFTATGVLLFLFCFSVGNITEVVTENWYIGQIGYIGIPIFIGLLAYSIVKFKIFNIKLLGAQALVASLWIILFAVLFVRTIENARAVIGFTLILFLVVGVLLIRSVSREVKQREEMAQMAEDVRRAYVIEKRAKEEIESLNKFKDQFLMTTQHNLRTPLTSMMGYSDLLLTGVFGKQSKKTIEVIEKFQVLTKGMIKMVNDFLNMAQFQLGKEVVSLRPDVDLSLILSEIATELEFKSKTKGLYLKLEKPEKMPTISADREKLKASLFNVIDNAVKYTPKGGVTIKVEIDNNVKITVSDTGIGIPEGEIKGLFDSMFSRGEEAKRLDAVGSGVGLYLSGQIIKAHKGTIWVESSKTGSTFHIEIPIVSPAPVANK